MDHGPMRHRPLLQVRKLFRRGRCPHRPGKIPTVWRRGGYHPPRRIRTSSYSCLHQARFSRPAGQPSQDCPASGSGADAESISCTTRAGCAEPPQESAPRKWGPGLATGALALLGDKPRGSLVLSILGKNTIEVVVPLLSPAGRLACAMLFGWQWTAGR